MEHERKWIQDRQLALIVALWGVVLVGSALAVVAAPPSSSLDEIWAKQEGMTFFLVFAFLGPPLLVLAAYFFAARDPLLEGLESLIDRRFGKGSASMFWRRLRPLWLVSVALVLQGSLGLATSAGSTGSSAVGAMSRVAVAAGAGFAIGALLEGQLRKNRRSR